MITLKTLDKASAQEVFDQIKTHLLTQNKKCSINGDCYYRLENLKCAAGCLIGDDEYLPEFENKAWFVFPERFNITHKHLNLIKSLQIVHDCREVENWPTELKQVAKKFNLNY